MMEDAEAIEAVRGGDNERYAELVERHKRMVYGIAWSRLGDADLCEDAAQETFVKAFRCLGALRSPEKFQGWLARIARSVSTSLLRSHIRELNRRKRWELDVSAHTGEPSNGPEESLGETLRKMLSELPEQDRAGLVLFYMEGKSVREAAEALGVSEGAMKTRLHRARQNLRGRLEERLEKSLADMGPREGFSKGVLALLPTAPIGAAGLGGVGGASVLAKPLFGYAALLPVVILPVFQGIFASVFFGWLGKLEDSNLVAGEGNGFRSKIVRANVVTMILVVFLTFLIFGLFTAHFGPITLFRWLAVYCVWGMYSISRRLRVNRSRFVVGQVVAMAFFLAIFILIGFLHAPFWIFFAGMLPLNIYLYQTNKGRPMRHDYNLFLRQAKGLLGEPPVDAPARERFSRAELHAFVQFLGARFLAIDYKRRADGFIVCLPPVKPGIEQQLGMTGSKSSLRLFYDGRCEARVGRQDVRSIEKLTGESPAAQDEIERDVSRVVCASLNAFIEGRTDEAEHLLQAEPDEHILRKPVGESSEHRIRGGLAIAAAVFLLVLVVVMGPSGFLADTRAKSVSATQAREVLAGWTQDPWHGQITLMLLADKLPPIEFFGDASRAYKQALAERLLNSHPGELPVQIEVAFGFPRLLYHILDGEVLSMDELAALGFTPQSVRETLQAMPGNRMSDWNNAENTVNFYDGRLTNAWDVNETATRLAVLKAFNYLNFVDRDALIARIAAGQVTATTPPTDGRPLDRELAAGLFDFGICDLDTTRGALWALESLDALDRIDREGCIEGILRLHRGKGVFKAPRDSGIRAFGNNDDDAFHALDALRILGALDRIDDLDRWNFKPKTGALTQNGKTTFGVVTHEAIVSWGYRLFLEEVLSR